MDSESIKNFFYYILDNNEEINHIFEDLTTLENHEIDKEKLRGYIEQKKLVPGCKKYCELMEELFDSFQYISATEAKVALNNNIEDIKQKHREGYTLAIAISNLSQTTLSNSNMFYTLYLLYHLKNDGITVDYFFSSHFQNYIPEDDTRKYLIIFSDDFSYSGGQLLDDGIRYILGQNDKIYHDEETDVIIATIGEISDNVKIYLNIIGFTTKAKERILNYLNSTPEVIPGAIPGILIDNFNNFVEVKEKSLSVGNFLNHFFETKKSEGDPLLDGIESTGDFSFLAFYDCIKVISDVPFRLKPMLHSLLENKDKTLIYLFSKYPDGASTYNQLCFFELNYPFLNVEKMIEQEQEKLEDIKSIVKKAYLSPGMLEYSLKVEYNISLSQYVVKPEIEIDETDLLEDGIIKTFPFELTKERKEYMVSNDELQCNYSIDPFYKKIDYKINGNTVDKKQFLMHLIPNFAKNMMTHQAKRPRSFGGKTSNIKKVEKKTRRKIRKVTKKNKNRKRKQKNTNKYNKYNKSLFEHK